MTLERHQSCLRHTRLETEPLRSPRRKTIRLNELLTAGPAAASERRARNYRIRALEDDKKKNKKRGGR